MTFLTDGVHTVRDDALHCVSTPHWAPGLASLTETGWPTRLPAAVAPEGSGGDSASCRAAVAGCFVALCQEGVCRVPTPGAGRTFPRGGGVGTGKPCAAAS